MLADLGMCADVVDALTRRVDWVVGSRRGLGRLQHAHTRYLSVLQRIQEGDLHMKKEPGDKNVSGSANKTSGRETHDEPVDNDGLRVQRWENLVGARRAVTSWRLKSSMSLRRLAFCFEQHGISERILLEARESRAVLGVAACWLVACRSRQANIALKFWSVEF